MQQLILRPGPDITPKGNGNARTQKIMIVVLTLFAFSGLLGGFTVGAFTRTHDQAQLPTQHNTTTTVNQATPTPSPTPGINVAAVGIGCPKITTSSRVETADGTTAYTFAAQVVDKSIESKSPCGQGKPLFAPNITCKIWLTRRGDSLTINSLNQAGDAFKPENLQNAFPGEEQNALTFDGSNAQQVQQCSQTGPTTWTYKLTPALRSGTYYLAIISDWQGQAFNWSWTVITIRGQGGGDNNNNNNNN